ncbi:MAG: polysaccharide biosynthesis protein, partial [Oscillospiraceae bacterium]|nr:polysaccharide biosynthesis protein [Oscillospiraceae bacterium]
GIVICIFLFVRKPTDLWKYTLIITVGNLISLIIILPLIFRYTDFRRPDFRKIASHIRPNVILFLPIIATSVYQYLSKIMLDSWSTEAEVGFYQNAENIVTLPSFVTTAIETVLMPYASNLVAKGNDDEQLFRSTVKYTSVMSIAMAFGMFAIAGDFIPWYLGKGFERSAVLVMMMAPIVFFNSFSTVMRYQYIIPHEMDRANLIAMFSGAGADIILNFILIPRFGAAGAAVATVASYLVTLLIQAFVISRRMEFFSAVRSFLPSVLFGVLMVFCVRFISGFSINIILKIGLELIIGAAVFLICTVVWLAKTGDPVFANLFRDLKRRLKG